jgi:type I restriction enzyme S subunit
LSRTASVGFVAIMGNPMATSQDFANWVCGDDLDPEFLMYALIQSRDYLRGIATGSTHKTIYMPKLEMFHVLHPPCFEQKQIVAQLKAQFVEIERARGAAEIQLSDLKLLPKKLLSRLFQA